MCDADVSVLTYNWVKHHHFPHANFNVEHKCRNFEDVLDWANDHQAPAPSNGQIVKQPGYVEFSEPPFNPHAHT